MKVKHILVMTCLIYATGCVDQEEVAITKSLAPVSAEKLQEDLFKLLQEQGPVKWEWVSSAHVFSALTQEDSILTVGYQPAGYEEAEVELHTIAITDQSWTDARETILDEIQSVYDRLGAGVEVRSQVVLVHETLPYFKIRVASAEVIERLRHLGTVRYAEPASFTLNMDQDAAPDASYRAQSEAGCGANPAASIPAADYTTIAPGGKVPWNYQLHNIPSAWNYSTGTNITVGLIDTGISPDQLKLNSQFNFGYSTGRTVSKYGTYGSAFWWWQDPKPDGPDDRCGHGTQMAGTIVAPRTSSGSSIGVAYNASLVAVRGTGDVIINSGDEKDGVTDALVLLGKRSDVRIISMSIGDVFHSGQVADGVRYAHGKGKLLICAAGTSLTWTSWWGVIFPANMGETVAVTGIKDNGYNRCNICHDGSAVDFVVTMQRSSAETNSLTLALSGDQPAYVGGSSVATATTAGVAALIWATNPGQTREQVLSRMKSAAEFYPARHGSFGWGKIDVLKAVK